MLNIKTKLISFLLLLSLQSMAQSSDGTDFWFSFLEHRNPNQNSKVCFINSKVNTSGTISLPGKNWSKNFNVTANIITKIKLPKEAETIGNEKIDNNAVHVTTLAPSSVYIHQYHQWRAEACLVLPVPALGRYYYTMSYSGGFFSGFDYPSEFVIVGTEDSTLVDIILNDATLSGKPKGSTISILLNQGETYQVQGKKGVNDMTGSYISATKPVAVMSGNKYTKIPADCFNRDNILEQMAPITSWGKKYIVIPFKDQNSSIIRMMASKNNTSISVKTNSNETNYTLDAGQFVEFQLTQPSYIEGNDAFTIAQFMKGRECNGNGLGDPAMVMLNSLEQIRDTVTLFSSNLEQIQKKYIAIVTITDNIDNITYNGQAITSLSQGVNIIAANPYYSFISFEVQSDNHIIISSGCGIIAYGYGIGNQESYAYSAGASFSNINDIDLPIGGCLNDTILFDSKLSEDRYLFDWDLGDGNTSTASKFDHIYNTLGTYQVELILTDICLNTKDTFNRNIIISLRDAINAGPDIDICEQTDIQLFATDKQNSTYLWQGPNGYYSIEQNPIIEITGTDQTGYYSVIATASGCSTYPDTTEVIIRPHPIPELGEPIYICPRDETTPIVISPGTFEQYQWNDGSTGPSLTLMTEGTYSITVENEFHCRGEDSLLVIELCPTVLTVPNVFKPNSNDINGSFGVSGTDILDIKMRIYDRWGNLIFESSALEERWDGTFKGDDVKPAVFAWILEYTAQDKNGKMYVGTKTGDVTLIR